GAGTTLGTPVAIAAGDAHTCLVSVDGSVWCWGDNSSGQLGTGTFVPLATSPTGQVNLGNAVAIASGSKHSCALLADGTIRCWGDNSKGQVGDGSTTNRFAAVPVTIQTKSGVINLNHVTAIAAGKFHTCAVVADRTLGDTTVRCWGDNTNGQLGDNSTLQRNRPVP